MRVIAGRARGRPIACPKGRSTRPTSDRVRESLFAIIGQRVQGSRVLDLFAGCGSLGIEALSRGADMCVLVDCDRRACRVITHNLQTLGLEKQALVVCTDAVGSIRQTRGGVSENAPYDLVFADPPYALGIAESLLLHIDNPQLLAGDGVFVVEHSSRADWPARFGRLEQARQERYGDSKISFYQFVAEG
ncbi:MAG TPA: 16S rRNA (guanine(966)-N(2))-methyltransferase RsmD [Firmicutes bacterium]|jgi:16S rRNA (guanine(966)-N(2))-methyltransferase RsmD|nr:16S rRNA (guanine(966)-N(2))-methyltransferase RsmD [Bacillota bacterium]